MRAVALLLVSSALVLADDAGTPAGTSADVKALVRQARDGLTKQEGYHVKIAGNYAMGEADVAMSYESQSTVKGDLAWSQEKQMGIPMETFRKGSKIVVKDPGDGEWKDSSEMGGLGVGSLQDPNVVVGLLDKTADTAEFDGEEKVGDVDCRRVVLRPKPEILKEFLAAQGIPDLGLDFSKGKVDFHAWIGKEDSLFRRFSLKGEFEMAMPEENPQPGAPKQEPMKVTASVEVLLFDYGKDLQFEVPDKVKKLLGL